MISRGTPPPSTTTAGQFTVAAGERRVLDGIAPGRVTVEGDAEGSVRAGTLWLERGRVRLQGDGATVETPVAQVVALGADADVDVELQRRPDMGKTTTAIGGVAAVGAAVLSVYVLHGAARVEARPPGSSAPTLLATGDRAIRMPGAPTLAVRASSTIAALGVDPNRTRPSTELPVDPRMPPSMKVLNDEESKGHLDKESIRASIEAVVPKVAECYENAINNHPNLSGRIIVSFKIKNVDGKGKIDEAEVIPSEGKDDLNSPSVEHCILQVVAGAEFPAPEGGDVVVHFPFVLQPPDDEHKE